MLPEGHPTPKLFVIISGNIQYSNYRLGNPFPEGLFSFPGIREWMP